MRRRKTLFSFLCLVGSKGSKTLVSAVVHLFFFFFFLGLGKAVWLWMCCSTNAEGG